MLPNPERGEFAVCAGCGARAALERVRVYRAMWTRGSCVCVRGKWGPTHLLSRERRFDVPYDRSRCNANDRGCNAGSCGCNADSCGCYADRSSSYADRSSTYADGCGSYADRSSRYAGGCGCYADDRRSQRGDRGVGPRRRSRVSGDPLRKDCRWDRGGSGLPIPGG